MSAGPLAIGNLMVGNAARQVGYLLLRLGVDATLMRGDMPSPCALQA